MLLIDDRWFGTHGIGRFAQEVALRIGDYHSISHEIPKLHIFDPIWQSLEIVRHNPEVYFNPGYNPPLFSKVPFVFTIHDLNHLHNFGNESILKRLCYDYLIKPACHRAFKVLTVSEFSKQEIIEWGGLAENKVIVAGNGCNTEFTQQGAHHSPGFSYFLYVGNHKPHKNLINLLRGFALLPHSVTYKLLLSGEPDPRIVELIKHLDIQKRVDFCGAIPDKELPDYYRGATALLLPSYYEGFGLPIIEAMACGTPVITSNVSAMPETAGGAALLVDPHSPENIASSMYTIIHDNELRESLIHQGLIRSKIFSWDKVTKTILEVISQAKEHKI